MFYDLEKLEVKTVSRNILDYSMMITAPSGFGKTPFLAELFGERALFLALENSTKGIAGIYSVNVDSYNALDSYVTQLEKPTVREKFDIVVIDTLNMLDYMCEKAVTDQYGKDLIGDCLGYNKGYKVLDKRFMSIIKRLQKMDYTICYVCHPTEKKLKINGADFVRYEPKVSDRVQTMLLPEIDIKLFCHFDEKGEKAIFTQGTALFDARVRGAKMPPKIPFTVEALKREFADGIDRAVADKSKLVDKIEDKNNTGTSYRPFDVVMQEIMALGEQLYSNGKQAEADNVIFKALGCDENGRQRTLTEANPDMIGVLELIASKLKEI